MDQVGGTACQSDLRARLDAVKYFVGRRPRSLTFQKFLNVVGQGLAPRLRPARQFAVQAVGNISHLDHLRHALSMSHAARMFKREPWPMVNGDLRGRRVETLGVVVATSA